MPTLSTPTRVLWGAIALLSAAIALVSYRYLAGIGPLAPNVLQNVFRRPWLDLHIAGAATALLVGPLQFLGRIRRWRTGAHRWLGRAYVAGCLFGAAGGLVLAFGSTAGPIATLGFGGLAVVWTIATAQAWRLALLRRFLEHRAWMIRSFALTFAAVTLRLGLPVAPLLGFSFVDGYRALSILSWVANLALAEAWLAWSARARRRPTAAANMSPLQPE